MEYDTPEKSAFNQPVFLSVRPSVWLSYLEMVFQARIQMRGHGLGRCTNTPAFSFIKLMLGTAMLEVLQCSDIFLIFGTLQTPTVPCTESIDTFFRPIMKIDKSIPVVLHSN